MVLLLTKEILFKFWLENTQAKQQMCTRYGNLARKCVWIWEKKPRRR